VILDCNQGLAEISGYSIDELVGMDGLLLIAESSREMVMANIQAGYEKPYEAMGLRKNGQEYPIRLEARNIPYKGQPVRAVEFRDISSRKKAEEELKDSELRHRVIFENSPLGMVRFSQEGVILDCNDHFVGLMGSSRERLIGFSTLKESNELMRESLRKAIEGQPSAYEDYYTSVTGNRTVYLRVQFNPVDMGKIPTEVIATLEDYSDRKEYQDHLQQAKDEAEKASYAKTMFLANMSHELRTPLNGIMGMQQLLKSTNLDKEQDEYVTLAIQSAQRLTGLLGDILDLTKIESGKMSIVEKSFDLDEVFDLVKQLFGPSCDQKGITLTLRCDETIPKRLLGDPVRLQQILNNLVGNAVKFTDVGEIACEASLLHSDESDVVRVFFSVADSGIGIKDKDIEYLFGEFTQADESYRRSYQGAGLGLSIVRRLIHLLGGNLVVESQIGVGTTFSFSMPFAIEESCKITRSVAGARIAEGKFSQPILLVEDEAVNQLATKSILEKADMRVVAVSNGEEAIQEVASGDYGLVLMDIQMPVMDGVEATRKIRNGAAGEGKKKIPIIALTAHAMDGDRESFLGKGIDGYIAKPVDVSLLMSTINEVLYGQE
jgi:PAS domain S-box-containing protein